MQKPPLTTGTLRLKSVAEKPDTHNPPPEILTLADAHATMGPPLERPISDNPPPILTLGDLKRARLAQAKYAHHGIVVPHTAQARQLELDFPYGSWEGRRAFIIGGGPSLKKFNWDLLKGELVIGINRAIEYCDPSILFSIDIRFWRWLITGQLGDNLKQKFESYDGYKVWLNTNTLNVPDEDVYLTNIPSGGNSGHAALNLALKMKANPIYLLGFDLCGDNRGRQRWFHHGYPEQEGTGMYVRYRERFEKEATVRARLAGVRVVNLNSRSALKCFEFGKVADAFAGAPSRPMVVSYYTRNTGYREEAMKLARTVHGFGLEHDIREVPNLGSWQANTQYKAKFIREMMDTYPDRNLLWLDADSLIKQYPSEFDNATYDLGVHTIDWAQYGRGNRRDHQVANAVIYLKNKPNVRAFVDEWVAANEAAPDKIEMQTMAQVMDRWTSGQDGRVLDYHNIPATYCQIFDLMAEAGNPVILQTQASRHLRGAVGAAVAVEKEEKEKYEYVWKTAYRGPSQCAIPTADYIARTSGKSDTLLDLGCGDGTTALFLRDMGYQCGGVDITLCALKAQEPGFTEAPLWDTPFADNEFDYTFSTDVLEHIPTEMVPATLKEIIRITRGKTYHCIAMFKGIHHGRTLHMTLKPIEWWRGEFAKLNTKGVDSTFVTRAEFMKNRKGV